YGLAMCSLRQALQEHVSMNMCFAKDSSKFLARAFRTLHYHIRLLYSHSLTCAILEDPTRETLVMLRHPRNAMMIHRALYIGGQLARDLSANLLATFYSIVLFGLSYAIYGL